MTTAINMASTPVPGDVRSRWSAKGSTECRSSCKGHRGRDESPGPGLNPPLEDQSDDPSGGGGGLQFTNRKKVASVTTPLQKEDRLTREAIAEAIALIGWTKLADQLKDCGSKVFTFKCSSCETTFEAPHHCHHRLCPECAPRRAMKLFDRHASLMSAPTLKHIVLTVQTSLQLTPAYVRGLVEAFNKLRRKVYYRKSWTGGIRQVEFVYTPRSSWAFDERKHKFYKRTPGWHVHIHLLVEGKYVPQEKLAKDWKAVTKGAGTIVWIERAKNPMQALKYVLKPGLEILDDPEALDGFIETIQSLHLVSGFGAYWKIRGERSACYGRRCPECGCSALEYLGSRYLIYVEHRLLDQPLPARAPPSDQQLTFSDPGQRRLL